MEHTEHQLREFQDQFSRRRKHQLLVSVPVIALILAFMLTQDEGTGTAMGLPVQVAAPVFLVAIAGVLIFSLRNWRCPACSKYLGKAMTPRHCHACGVQLRA